MSVATYKHEFQAICERLDEAATGLLAAAETGSEHAGALEAITSGSARPEADEAKGGIAEAENKLNEAVQALQAAKSAIEAYMGAV